MGSYADKLKAEYRDFMAQYVPVRKALMTMYLPPAAVALRDAPRRKHAEVEEFASYARNLDRYIDMLASDYVTGNNPGTLSGAVPVSLELFEEMAAAIRDSLLSEHSGELVGADGEHDSAKSEAFAIGVRYGVAYAVVDPHRIGETPPVVQHFYASRAQFFDNGASTDDLRRLTTLGANEALVNARGWRTDG